MSRWVRWGAERRQADAGSDEAYDELDKRRSETCPGGHTAGSAAEKCQKCRL